MSPFTQDLDLVVRIDAHQVLNFEKLFPIDEYYCPPVEVIRDEVIRKGSFNLIHQGSGIKVDIMLDKRTAFFNSEFSRRRKVEIAPDIEIYIASPEDLILKKLDFYREGQSEKQLLDIREVIMAVTVDNVYIEDWVERLSLRKEWHKAKNG